METRPVQEKIKPRFYKKPIDLILWKKRKPPETRVRMFLSVPSCFSEKTLLHSMKYPFYIKTLLFCGIESPFISYLVKIYFGNHFSFKWNFYSFMMIWWSSPVWRKSVFHAYHCETFNKFPSYGLCTRCKHGVGSDGVILVFPVYYKDELFSLVVFILLHPHTVS